MVVLAPLLLVISKEQVARSALARSLAVQEIKGTLNATAVVLLDSDAMVLVTVWVTVSATVLVTTEVTVMVPSGPMLVVVFVTLMTLKSVTVLVACGVTVVVYVVAVALPVSEPFWVEVTVNDLVDSTRTVSVGVPTFSAFTMYTNPATIISEIRARPPTVTTLTPFRRKVRD